MAERTPPPPKLPRSLDEPYVAGDTIPAPDVKEEVSDTAWNLFNTLSDKQDKVFAANQPAPSLAPVAPAAPAPQVKGDRRYAKTEPSPLRPHPKAAANPAPTVTALATIDEVMVIARRNNRICPREASWLKLYELLPGKAEGTPAPPLAGAALLHASSLARRMFLRDHIEWADAQGGLQPVHDFLKALPEGEWHHMGE